MPVKVSVREATSADLPAVTRLLCRRDGRQHDPTAVHNILFGLQPERLLAWVAWADDEPVGLTSLYVRTLRFDSHTGMGGGKVEKKAGYWAHLFVDEDYRRLMIFPRLMIAMVRGAKSGGLELLYTITRQPKLAEACGKFGFALVARQTALIRPLRPLALVAKQFGMPAALTSVAAPVDALYGAFASRVANSEISVGELESSSPDCGAIVEMLNAMGEGLISQKWTLDQFRRRFSGTIDSYPYTLLVARRGGDPVAAMISRMAERGNGIRVGVILEACWYPDEAAAAAVLLQHAQRRAYQSGAEVMLTMDSLGEGTGSLVAPLPYRSTSELHHLLVWDSGGAPADGFGADPKHWRFAYSDHDAF
ncbi:MAG: GNAT family N-acetyltransferase [Myxococcota bacterium]